MERCSACGEVVNPRHAHLLMLSDEGDESVELVFCTSCVLPIMAYIHDVMCNAQYRANRHLN